MNILIINCHTDNRGDEAAVHALVDELNSIYKNLELTLSMRGEGRYPNLPDNVTCISQFIPAKNKSIFANHVAIISKGKINISQKEKVMINAIKHADIILHAPGGPSIGDTYYNAEPTYLRIFDLLKALNKPYMFYAPSMGPFNNSERNAWRRKVLLNAKAIVLRDPISANYVKELVPEKQIYLTLDSAFQHDIDILENENKFSQFKELRDFISKHEKCIGITITDLKWHPVWSKKTDVIDNIRKSFTDFIKEKIALGYGIVFIPQLYGSGNDYNLMDSYCEDKENCFVIPDNDDRYDTYFQQYVISKLYAVIGMRYHSNIFSAKMGTPFISVSYEQKMQGFMEKAGLLDYCLAISDLSVQNLHNKFESLVNNYTEYKNTLEIKKKDFKKEASRTTELVCELLNK